MAFQNYIDFLKSGVHKPVAQNLIQVEKYHLKSKVALDEHDVKRYLIQGSHETLPWGHYFIMDI